MEMHENNSQGEDVFNPSSAMLFGETVEREVPSIMEESKKKYFGLIETFNSICIRLKTEEEVQCNELVDQINEFIDILREDDRMLMGLANAPYTYSLRHLSEGIFGSVVIHGINVMIYSVKIAIDLGVPQNRLPYIAVASLCYRLGLLDVPDDELITLHEQPENIEAMKNFEQNAKKFTQKIKIDDFHTESIDFLITLVKEDQQVLSKTSLHEAMYQYAMVIHICNEFEKLTHQKTYGEIFAPVDAMKRMRNEMKDFFNQDIVKLFFNKLSIFPLGSFVKLSSREVAKIVGINENFIMRPIVMIVLDEEGREKFEPVKINLREKPNLYIKKAVLDDFLTEKFIDLF